MKLIEIWADPGHDDTLAGIAEQREVVDCWRGPSVEGDRRLTRMLVRPEQTQAVLDALQQVLGGAAESRITVQALETVLPRLKEPETDTETEDRQGPAATREALYESVEKNARLDRNFVLLVVLSTVVAAIGLVKNNAAVVIGAMVIAPLLGPNLALAMGTALGDSALMLKAAVTNLVGLGLAIALSFVIGTMLPHDLSSHELMTRTDVGLDSVALALASGAAAVLSMTTGLPAVLVGVMVAVALLPPAATFGLMLGFGFGNLAVNAGLLLAVNVVCVNLAAKVVLLVQGVKPRTWLEKRAARQSMVIYIVLWIVTLAALVGIIYLKG